jgi:hypothetical protein
VVIEDPESEFSEPDELEAYLDSMLTFGLASFKIAAVRRGGLLADKVMDELPPTRHKLMGRPRG